MPLAAVLFGVLVMALAGLVVGFALSAAHADRQFARASLSEQQAAAVARIVALAREPGAREPGAPEPGSPDQAGLEDALRSYRGLIAQEAQSIGTDAEQLREAGDAALLERLAHARRQDGASRARFLTLARAIDRREAAEVRAVRAALALAGRRSVVLAVLLAGVALACAGVGGWLLWRSNRTLGALVEARTARIAAVDASRRLFFAKASHELRTPVAGLRSAAEVALEAAGDDTTMLREALHQAVAGATFLSHRIDELLGLAGADEGQLVLAQARFDLAQCVGEALAEAKAYARSVEVELALVLPDDAASGLPMTGDARWLRQALLAVIENGLKFAPMHSVLVVGVERIGDARVAVCVTDRGPGIVAADLPRIFDAYYQAQAGRERGGSGLGLALARWVVEQHGGQVRAANVARDEQGGGGCVVRFDLPLSGPLEGPLEGVA